MNPAKTIQPTPTTSALLAACLIGAAATSSASAQAEATGLFLGKLTGETAMDRAWSAATLYKNENNPILQEFALQGMAQLQWAEVHEGDTHYAMDDIRYSKGMTGHESYWGDELEVRRLRLGIKSKWFNVFKLDGNLDLDPNFNYHLNDPDILPGFAKQILDLYVSYAPSDAFNLMLGKREVKFSREQEISSKEILTFERGLLANALYPGELTGVWVNGKGIADHWLYEAGVYSNERSTGFSGFQSDNGAIVLLKGGYDYSGFLGTDTAVVGVHYMHNTDPGNTAGNGNGGTSGTNLSARRSPNFSDDISIYTDLTKGRFGLTSEVIWANGERGQADVMGFTIIPSYFIMDGLQLVGRFQVAGSSRANGLSLPGRYEAIVAGDDKGSRYLSTYLGLNYYLYGHKLKIMTGIEYASMSGDGRSGDYDGYTFLTGARFSF